MGRIDRMDTSNLLGQRAKVVRAARRHERASGPRGLIGSLGGRRRGAPVRTMTDPAGADRLPPRSSQNSAGTAAATSEGSVRQAVELST